MRYIISLSLLLIALWLGASGVYKPLLFILGGASVALVVWLSLRMDVVGIEHDPAVFSWRLPVYWGWLLWQIVLTNWHVARLCLNPAGISPRMVSMPVPQNSAVGKVTYGNSVILTPGTCTVHLTDETLVAHALDERSARDLETGEMAAKICWLERQPESPP